MDDGTPRTVTDYQLAVDYFGAITGRPGTEIRQLGVVTEAAALEAAREALKDSIVWRVGIYAREVPVDWSKVEELRPEPAARPSA